MITYQYKSKSKRIFGVSCVQCDDLETENSVQELYIVATSKQRVIRYFGMSKDFWSNRPVKNHNEIYNNRMSKYPSSYTIYRFKCDDAGLLERAGLELIKDDDKVWNRVWNNGFELTENSKDTIEMLCLTYNLKINASSKKA